MPPAEQPPHVFAFIPAALDDANLTPNEFRVYCAILRRGNCFESAANIASRCRMHRDTVWAALRSLEARGAILRTSRAGSTSLLSAVSVSLWNQPSGNGGSAENNGYPSKPGDTKPLSSATTQRKERASHPAESEGCKGNPIEVNPSNSLPSKEAGSEIIPASNRPDGIALPLSEIVAYGAPYGISEEKCRQWFRHLNFFPTKNWKRGLLQKDHRDSLKAFRA